MSGIVGSRLNIRGSGLVGSLGTDGQALTSSGAGTGMTFEAAGGFAVGDITGATDLAAIPDNDDELVISDGGTLKRVDYKYLVPFNTIGGCFSHGNQHTITDATYVKILLSSTKFNRGLTFSSNRITIPSGGDGDYYCSAFIDFNTYAYGAFGAGTVAIFVNGSGVKYATIDTRKAADDYNARSGHIEFNGILGDLNADDYIEVFTYVMMEQLESTYRAANGTMITLFKVNND